MRSLRLVSYALRLRETSSIITYARVVTDFVAAGGPNNYAWNVVRSEADNLIFQHAGKSGAKIFDGTKVESIDFEPLDSANGTMDSEMPDLGRPVSATWSRKDGTSGKVKFEYIVDASGRAGLVSTKYLKNRRYNQGLKNVANWGYWEGVGEYGTGTKAAGQPYFEALQGTSLFKFVPWSLSGANAFPFRCEWLGLVYPPTQRYYVHRNRHEPRPFRLQEEGNGLSDWSRVLPRVSQARTGH